MTRRTRTKRSPEASLAKQTAALAASIGVPVEQRDNIVTIDVKNVTEDDKRHMVRSKQEKTVRRLSRVELMQRAGIITADQAIACAWYAHNYEMAFEYGQGTTANYGGAGGGGGQGWDHGPRSMEQGEARRNIFYARLGIPEHLLWQFEVILTTQCALPQRMAKIDKVRFSLAAFCLHSQVAHMLTRAA